MPLPLMPCQHHKPQHPPKSNSPYHHAPLHRATYIHGSEVVTTKQCCHGQQQSSEWIQNKKRPSSFDPCPPEALATFPWSQMQAARSWLEAFPGATEPKQMRSCQCCAPSDGQGTTSLPSYTDSHKTGLTGLQSCAHTTGTQRRLYMDWLLRSHFCP